MSTPNQECKELRKVGAQIRIVVQNFTAAYCATLLGVDINAPEVKALLPKATSRKAEDATTSTANSEAKKKGTTVISTSSELAELMTFLLLAVIEGCQNPKIGPGGSMIDFENQTETSLIKQLGSIVVPGCETARQYVSYANELEWFRGTIAAGTTFNTNSDINYDLAVRCLNFYEHLGYTIAKQYVLDPQFKFEARLLQSIYVGMSMADRNIFSTDMYKSIDNIVRRAATTRKVKNELARTKKSTSSKDKKAAAANTVQPVNIENGVAPPDTSDYDTSVMVPQSETDDEGTTTVDE